MQSLGLLLQVAVALSAVLGVIWISAKLARRSGLAGAQSTALRVVGRQMLGRDSSVALITVGERAYVLGVTAHHVSLLSEVDAHATLPEQQTVSAPAAPSRAALASHPGAAVRPAAAPFDVSTLTRAVDRLRAKTVRQ